MKSHSYPDVSDILARKAEGRKVLASLTFSEKLAILEQMRSRVTPFRRAREKRVRDAAVHGGESDRK